MATAQYKPITLTTTDVGWGIPLGTPVWLGGTNDLLREISRDVGAKDETFTPFFLFRLCCSERWLTRSRFLLLLNFFAFVFHIALALLVLFLSMGQENWKTHGGVLLPVYRSRLRFNMTNDDDNSAASWELYPEYLREQKYRIELNLTWMTIGFFALSAFFHAILWVAPLVFQKSFYYRWIDECQQPLRWCEYSLSASLMIVIIAFFSGVRDSFLLLALFFLSACTIAFGWVTEELSRPDESSRGTNDKSTAHRCTRWENPNRYARLLPHILGWVPYVIVWLIILSNFYYSVDMAKELGDDNRGPPDFVYAIVWGQLAIHASFAVCQLLQQSCDWGCRNYWAIECVYILLSFVSKGLLGGILLANLLLISGSVDDALAENAARTT